MLSSRAPALRVIACVLLSTGAAFAAPPPAAPPPAAEKSAPFDLARPGTAWGSDESGAVNLLRFDVGGSYMRGTEMVGQGSRVPYQASTWAMRFHMVHFPAERLGYEVKWWTGGFATPDTHLGLEGALDVAPLRWSGPFRGALVLGLGGGVELGDQRSLEEIIRAYPLVLSRLRLWPTRTLALHATWRFAPITSNARLTRFHEIEAAMSIGVFQLGARVGIEQTTAGDPERTYLALRLGAFLGAAAY